jgi:DNA-directed RNA polymerase specialized sigma24 family protein
VETHKTLMKSDEVRIGKEDSMELKSAIAELPLEYHEAVLLHAFEEFLYQRIANVLDRPMGVVMAYLNWTRAKLRITLIKARPLFENVSGRSVR